MKAHHGVWPVVGPAVTRADAPRRNTPCGYSVGMSMKDADWHTDAVGVSAPKSPRTSVPPIWVERPYNEADRGSNVNSMVRALFLVVAVAASAVGVAPTASADPTSDLMGMLPAGYSQGVCRPVENPPPVALAAVDCGNNSLPGGPTHARYILYPDAGTMMIDFRSFFNTPMFREQPCPGMDSAVPTPVRDQGGRQTGSIACGTEEDPRFDQPGQGSPAVIWTKLANRFIGNAHGSDIQSLFDWVDASGALG